MKSIDDLITEIAREHLGIETLETRNRDSLDFHDVSVWGVRRALLAAYEAGAGAAATGREDVGTPCARERWRVVNRTGMPEIRAGEVSIADIRLNGHNMKHGKAHARRIVAAANACEGIATLALEAGVLREMREALDRAAFLMRRVHDGDHRALRSLPGAAKEASAILTRANKGTTPSGEAGALPPIVIVTVRGGCVVTVESTVPLRVILEDWDCEDHRSGKKPYLAALPPTGHLSRCKATRCLRRL
jgi:hypothetical protein